MPKAKTAIPYLCSFFTVAISGFVALCLIPDDPYIRYQLMKGTIFESLAWVYERIHYDPAPIDIAILGGSRTGAAIDSPMLEELLASRGKQLKVVNFSIAASGYDIQFSLAKRLFAEKSPKVLLIGVVEQLPRDGHQAFADIADPVDILQEPLLINRNLARNVTYLPMRQLRSFCFTTFPEMRKYSRTWNKGAYLGSNPDQRHNATGTIRQSLKSGDETALNEESVRRRTGLAPPRLPESLQQIEFGLSDYYLDEILKLAKTKNTKVCFLYLPFYKGFDHPWDCDLLKSRGRLLEANFLKSDPRNFIDAAHASEVGSVLATRWLADQLNVVLGGVTE